MKEVKKIPLKLKKVFYNNIIQSVLISFIMMIVLFGIVFLFFWSNKKQVINYFVKEYRLEQQKILPPEIPLIKQKVKIENSVVPVIKSINKKIPTVVDAVKKAKPAVVSIIISKEVPKYNITRRKEAVVDKNGKVVPNLFIDKLVYTPDGFEKKELGSGSGFLVSADGLIVTNRHVVSGSGDIFTVFLNNGKKYTAKVLDRDPVLDIALIKIKGSNFPYLTLANSKLLNIGQTVIAIGNALGEFRNTVSVGVISGLSRSIYAGDEAGQVEFLNKVIQTDAAINKGNSGGPLLNINGNVVGVNVALVEGSSNIGFSLPIDSVKEAITSVLKTGRIIRPYIGIRYVMITPELKTKDNLPYDYGIWIQKGPNANEPAIIPNSPAEKAGLKEGDIILEVDNKKVSEDEDFPLLIRNKKIGDFVMMKVFSDGSVKTVVVVLKQAPNNYN